MAQTSRAYSAGKFLLELDGEVAGFLQSVEGGEAYATVVTERVDDNGVVPKHPGGVQFAPIQMSFGVGMSKEFYRWVGAMLERQGSAKSGAIILADFNYNERSRRTFDNAVITEVTFPKLDGGSKDAVSMSITIQPESTRISAAATGSAVSVFTTKSRPKWLGSNFRLTIAGLEKACRKVVAVEAIVVKQPVVTEGDKTSVGVVEVPNLVITFPESSSDEFTAWFNTLVVKGDADERTGSIELLDAALKKALVTLTLSNLGIVRVRNERNENNAEAVARITVELYCETLVFSVASESVGDIIPAPPPPPSAPAAPGGASATDTLLGIINGTIDGQAALRSALQVARSPDLTLTAGITKSELVARRLLTTVPVLAAAPTPPKRDVGISIGERWVNENGTLEEVQQIAALDGGDWTAVRLVSDHTLVAQLVDSGVLPNGAEGPIDLDRDAFVEGIVMGAAQALRSATPHLTTPAPANA